NVKTWGTHSNIRILENFGKHASPSDFLCQQSIDAIQPLKVVRKRHQIPSTPTFRSGEGKGKINTLSCLYGSTQAAIQSISADEEPTSPFTLEDLVEFGEAHQYGPLYAAAETPPSSICALQAADASRPFTKADHDEDQRAR